MKTIYTILSAILLSVLLFFGVQSGLRAPEPTAKNIASGQWFEDYLSNFTDTFAHRETLLAQNELLSHFYNFSALTKQDDVQLVIDFKSTAALGGEALQQDEPLSTSAPQVEPNEPTEPTETTESDFIPEIPEPEAQAEDLGVAILVGNRAMDVPYLSRDAIATYASSVNAIADSLGVRTFCIDVPNAAAFYAPKEYRTGDCDQKAMIELCYSQLNDNVIAVDAYTSIAKHMDEYIYFRTDHHWTQLGAYYAYTAFCKEAGFEVQPLEKFETGYYERFVGSMRTYLSGYHQANILSEQPDSLTYYKPFVEVKSAYYYDGSLSYGYAIDTLCYMGSGQSNKYLTYLGGDHPITIVETDVEGPVCLILKESYGNAFVPWLTSHYSKIIAIDPREFNRSDKPSLDLVAFAQAQGVDDCIVLDYPILLNSPYYADWLGRLVR